ncbi:MAG: trypsin-like peptidase domain-containing protein [Phycisphaerales bacterium]|nr:trypsin-like peptidase domain-containing protein [Phycisphaerales bacterium]
MKSVQLMGCSIVLLAGTAMAVESASVVDRVDTQESSLIAQREIPVSVSSGVVVADAVDIAARDGIHRPQHVLAWSEQIEIPDAGWVRLRFGEVHLAPGTRDARESYLRVTSLADGYEQYLDADALRKWRGTSAYFNGGAVLVELMVSPTAGAGINDVEITSVMASEPTQFDRSLCGIDDRVLSSDPREARIMPIGCTGWLFGDQGNSMLTAGHCNMGNGGDVIQFNVPLSSAGGTPLNPPPQDQYPVDPASIQDTPSPTLGNDYAFYGVFDNTDTGLSPLDAQGDSFELATSLPPLDDRTIRITGYGSTVAPVDPSWYLVQKTHTGPLFNYSGDVVQYTVDTSGGNSGGSVFDEVNQNVIAIHTNAGCETVGGNQGCSLFNAGLQAALANPQGITQPRGLEIGPQLFWPDPLDPAGGQGITAAVFAANGLTPSGDVFLHTNSGAGFVAMQMTPLGGDLYAGEFPAAPCPSTMEFYFSATDTEGGVWTFPAMGAAAPLSALVAVDQIVAVSESFEADTGWTVTDTAISTGSWERAVPGNFGRDDPATDFDGSGQCFVTGNTSLEDVDGGPTVLTSPVYDLTGISEPVVEYARWFRTDDGNDFMTVEFSDDGGANWVFAESGLENQSGWEEVGILVTDHVSVTSQFRVRFTVSDNPNDSVTEAAVDAVKAVRKAAHKAIGLRPELSLCASAMLLAAAELPDIAQRVKALGQRIYGA